MKEDVDAIIVYATYPDFQTARDMADGLVGEGLAACVNLLDGMVSVYQWEGVVETARETVMIVKTRASNRDGVVSAIEERHPYDTPAVVVLDIVGGSERYLDWILSQTRVRGATT